MLKRLQVIISRYFLILTLCALMLTLLPPQQVNAEGFAMTEWSARGIGLAGGMVARANDVSTISYNAAGITQLPGTHMMFGGASVTPYGQIEGKRKDGSTARADTSVVSWMPVHGYISHQLNNQVWLGFGVFSRFGLGNGYDEDWFGRYNVTQISLQTVSAVPTIAYKFNDMFSASIGFEMMYISMHQKNKIPDFGATGLKENTVEIEGDGVGFGVHLGLHARLNEQWSVGLTYKSQVTQNIYGESKFGYSGKNKINGMNMYNSEVHGTMQLPDSVAFAIAYTPTDYLSFEVGTVWTRWSTYNSLDIYFEQPSGYNSLNDKKWKDGWNFNASVEYKALDWLTLRAGYWHETAVTNDAYADYAIPLSGRDVVSLGLGFNWENWVLDLAYAHIWSNSADYSNSQAGGVPGTPAMLGGDIVNAKSRNMQTDIFMVSLGYTF